jgi:hypothetical protein
MTNAYFRGYLLVAGLLALASAAQAQTFGPMATFSTGPNSRPLALAVGDVNGDGHADVVTGNVISNYSVLLGTSTGIFQAPANYHLGPVGSTTGLAMGDVNKDGQLDIIVADRSFGTVRLLLGTGTGIFNYTFPTITTGNTTGTLESVALGDLNGDARLDIIAANPTNNTVEVLLGTSANTFPTVAAYALPTALSPSSLTVTDVNGDGLADVLVTGTGSRVGILLGTGTGALQVSATTYSTGANTHPYGVALGDINGDGRPDLVTANLLSDSFSILLGAGAGLFQPATIYSVAAGSGPSGVALCDINGDGRLDIITANFLSSSIGVLLNTTPLAARSTLPGTSATLHPNPAGAATTLSVAGLPAAVAQVQATLFDAQGRAMGQQQLATAQGAARAEVPTAGLAAGLYVLRLAAFDAQGQPVGNLPTQHLSVR